MMVKAVIFDLDGLLIDSEIISYRTDAELLKKYGYDFSIEEYAADYSGRTGIDNMNRMIERYHLPITNEEGRKFVKMREWEYVEQGIALKDGAEELLKFLKDHGCKVILASSSTRERAQVTLTKDGVIEYFDDMVFGAEVAHGKPAPDIFLKASEKVGEKPEDCLVLEDSEAGIQAAHAAGIPVICVPDMKTPGEQFQKMTWKMLSSLRDVITVLENEKSSL